MRDSDEIMVGSASRSPNARKHTGEAWPTVFRWRSERNVVVWLTGWTLLFLAFHSAIGPDELHGSHIVLGRHLLFGEPAPNPAHPMFGYAIIIAALGPLTLAFNTAIGWVGFVLAYRWLDLGRVPGSLLLYVSTIAYAGAITSWNDHAPWLGLILLSVAVLQKFGDRGSGPGLVVGLLWGLAYNIRPEALLLFPLFIVTQLALEILGYSAWRLRCHIAALVAFAVCMVPWAIYTTKTLGKFTPTTTHSWSVAYYSLGLVPNNKYGIVAQDEWLYDRAAEIGESSPWSMRANEHFHEEFDRIVKSDPGFFLQKIVYGVDELLRGGAYVPDLRLLMGREPETQMRLRYVARQMVESLGTPRILLSSAMRSMPERPPVDASTAENLVILGFLPLAIVFRAAFVIMLIALAARLFAPRKLLRQGPLFALTASTLALTFLVAAVFLPTSRMTTLPVVLGALLLQAVRCEAMSRSHHDRNVVTPNASDLKS